MDPRKASKKVARAMRGGTVRVEAACPVAWEDMAVITETIRHCDRCELRVYDLSDRSPSEIRALWRAHEGRLCAQVTVRGDGTVVAGDCAHEDLSLVRGGLVVR